MSDRYGLLAVIALSAASLAAAAPATDRLEPFTLDDFVSGRFSAKSFSGTWMTDTLLRYNNDLEKDVIFYDVTSNSSYVLLSSDVLKPYDGGKFYSFSRNGRMVAISYDTQKVYRHSTTARFAIYDVKSRKYQSVDNGAQLQTLAWAGDSGLLWVKEDNVYFRSDAMTLGSDIQITTTGRSGVYFNGVPDWVYEEEVLASGSAMWPSPDGSLLAFAAFDDKDVKHAFYFKYGEPGQNGTQYPDVVEITYPKVGTPNPDVHLMVVNLKDAAAGTVTLVDIPAPKEVAKDPILYGCFWSGTTLLASWTNRAQNLNIIDQCDTSSGKCTEGFRLQEASGWVDPPTLVMHSQGGRAAAIIPHDDRPHLAVITFSADGSDATVQTVTEGEISVLSVLGWDEQRGVLYYTATVPGNPAMQHAYRVALPGTDSNSISATPECLSCVKTPEGNDCSFGSASLSTGFSNGAILCSGPDPAFYAIYNMQTAGGPSHIRDWEKNLEVRSALANKLPREYVDLWEPVEGNFMAQVRLILPPGMDKSGSTKYPLLVYVYGGPDYNQVTTAFQVIFNDYLTSSRGIITALIDGRGSGKNGRRFLHSVYRQLGTVEIEDQIAVARKLQKQLPYVDKTRTAIWGWSYGGFATAHAMARDDGADQVFCCGVSVAPVTSFIYYDTIYTERYMGLPTPEDNLGGYNGTDVTRRVDNFRNKRYLLIHGNADDNVHYQQSMALSKALEEADIMFQQQSYPDEAHSLAGVKPHLYHTMDDFWTRAFGLPKPEWQS